MKQAAINRYFEQKILNSDPVELTRIVYERAISCVKQAREHLAGGRILERAAAINGAYAALAELHGSLRPEAAPELAGRLLGLYLYMQKRLLEANLRQAEEPLEEVLGLLGTLAEAWGGVAAQVSGEGELALSA